MLVFRHTVCLCVAFDSCNKQLVFLCTVFSVMSGNFVCTGKFIFVLWYAIVAFRRTTLPF